MTRILSLIALVFLTGCTWPGIDTHEKKFNDPRKYDVAFPEPVFPVTNAPVKL